MIIFDTSVLSALVRLQLLDLVKKLHGQIMISSLVFDEFSNKWKIKLPKWIQIQTITEEIPSDLPFNLSSADYSNIILAKDHSLPLATDDNPLREYAKSQFVTITGTLGLIKAMRIKGVITDNKMYKEILQKLSDDLYVSENLIQWALELSTED